jgi:hypothetical protein
LGVGGRKQGESMKRLMGVVWLVLVLAVPARAQMGMDLFRRPAIAKAFHPVVGKGALYEEVSLGANGSRTRSMEIAIVGKDTVDGKDAYWMQYVALDEKQRSLTGKSLVTTDDFQFHRMIVQMPGQGAMELPANLARNSQNTMNEHLSEWHSVGSDIITVPAGTFSCEHWRNDKDNADVWTSDKVTPFGMVKEAHKDGSTVLSKVLDSVPDRITGPVKPFDMQMIMQMQQQRQRNPE